MVGGDGHLGARLVHVLAIHHGGFGTDSHHVVVGALHVQGELIGVDGLELRCQRRRLRQGIHQSGIRPYHLAVFSPLLELIAEVVGGRQGHLRILVVFRGRRIDGNGSRSLRSDRRSQRHLLGGDLHVGIHLQFEHISVLAGVQVIPLQLDILLVDFHLHPCWVLGCGCADGFPFAVAHLLLQAPSSVRTRGAMTEPYFSNIVKDGCGNGRYRFVRHDISFVGRIGVCGEFVLIRSIGIHRSVFIREGDGLVAEIGRDGGSSA